MIQSNWLINWGIKIIKALILTLSIASCLSVAKAQQFQMPANGQ